MKTASFKWAPYIWLVVFGVMAAFMFAEGDIWWGVANIVVGLALFAYDMHELKRKERVRAEREEILRSFGKANLKKDDDHG